MLLSKVLKMQQDLEEEKNKAIIKDLEEKVENYEAVLKKKDFAIQDLEIMAKEHEGALEKKDFIIQSLEGSLAEVQAENDSLKNELLKKSEKYEQEKEKLEANLKAEVKENSNLQKSLRDLQEKCLNFGSRCVQRLKDVFHSIGANSEKFSPSAENLSSTLEHIEGEVDAVDEVIGGHADFCALVASRGTAAAFLKASSTHGKIVNRPNFSLSAADLIDIPSLARSIENRFMTQIWVNGRRRMAGDEARSHLKPVKNLYLLLLPSP
jgi:myosin heavy subunit